MPLCRSSSFNQAFEFLTFSQNFFRPTSVEQRLVAKAPVNDRANKTIELPDPAWLGNASPLKPVWLADDNLLTTAVFSMEIYES